MEHPLRGWKVWDVQALMPDLPFPADSSIQRSQKIRISGNPDFRELGISDFRISRNPDFRKSGSPEFRISEIPSVRISGIPDIRESGIPDVRISGYPNFWLLWMDESAGKGKSGIRACTSAHPRKLSIRAGGVPSALE